MSLTERITETYKQASIEVKKKLDAFLAANKAAIERKEKELAEGKITEAEYKSWLNGQLFRGRRWQEKLDDITKVYVDADKKAKEIVGGTSKNVFAEFANKTAKDITKKFKGAVSFDVYDKRTVEGLLKDDPQILPEWKINEPKDYRWNQHRAQNAITQGIVQGESIPKIAKRLSSELSASNDRYMMNFARTAITGAQNAGRVDMLHNAQEKGIKVRKKWLAALDNRTRDAHRDLNGTIVDVDEKFKVKVDGKEYEIDYPGDPTAAPEMVYNCRCTLTYVYDVAGSAVKQKEPEETKEQKAPTQTAKPQKTEKAEPIPTKKPKPAQKALEYTQDEKDAIESYVSGDTMWINQYLRDPSGFGGLSDSEKAMLKELEKATRKATIKDKVLYRSVDAQAVFGRMSDMDFENLKAAVIYGDKSKPAQSVLERVKGQIGKEITEKGFMSTTRDADIAYQWNGYTGSTKDITLELSNPDGVKGFDVEKMFEVEEDPQKEVLLQNGVTYSYDGIEKRETDDGTVIVIKATIKKK